VLHAELGAFEPAHCAGAILTGTDLAPSLTPALSLLVESQLGVAFLSSGRDVGTGITVAEPFTLASGVFTTSTRETTNGRLAVTA
jgi:flagellar biosynthesis GTPase FlhF